MAASRRSCEVNASPGLRQGSLESPSGARSLAEVIPSSPPPSYERVLEETKLASSMGEGSRAAGEVKSGPDSPGVPTSGAVAKRPEILHKSCKELYRAVAAQWGITCKMSDQCRCLDCQSKYFDCEYDQNEHDKTDGGLGAGTPMFISEVMQGTACAIL